MADKRVLVVDDDIGILNAVDRALTRVGWVVRGTLYPGDVPEMVEKERFDVVLLDIVMPGIDGLSLLLTLQELAPDLPAIMMTGYAIPKNIDAALYSRARGFLPKPFTPEELLEVVERVLKESRDSEDKK